MKKNKEKQSARMVFAANLRLARRLRDVSQEALALDAGLSRTYVSEVERGELQHSGAAAAQQRAGVCLDRAQIE